MAVTTIDTTHIATGEFATAPTAIQHHSYQTHSGFPPTVRTRADGDAATHATTSNPRRHQQYRQCCGARSQLANITDFPQSRYQHHQHGQQHRCNYKTN